MRLRKDDLAVTERNDRHDDGAVCHVTVMTSRKLEAFFRYTNDVTRLRH